MEFLRCHGGKEDDTSRGADLVQAVLRREQLIYGTIPFSMLCPSMKGALPQHWTMIGLGVAIGW